MRKFQILIIIISLLPCVVNAGTWLDRRSKLEKVAIFDKFRIFYSISGVDELPNYRKVELNEKGTPQFIENIGKRLIEADRFFNNRVNLKSPLKSKRYMGRAHYIDVNVIGFSTNSKGPRNGVAYDGTPKFNRSVTGEISTTVLTIDLSNELNLNSNTVEHELFHLYQNGYTYFKNRWYTEGTARWSELIINNRIGEGGALPKTVTEKEELFQKSYDANYFWNKLILNVDKNNKGKKFIKLLLEQLDYADDIVARNRGINNTKWKESEQRSHKNNSYIWEAAVIVNNRLLE